MLAAEVKEDSGRDHRRLEQALSASEEKVRRLEARFAEAMAEREAQARAESISWDDWTSHAADFTQADIDGDGRVSGEEAAPLLSGMLEDRLALRVVWALVDRNKDGFVSLEEFAAAMHLAKQASEGNALPEALPPGLLVKPSQPAAGDGEENEEEKGEGESRSPSVGASSAFTSGASVSPDGTLDALLSGAEGFMEPQEAAGGPSEEVPTCMPYMVIMSVYGNYCYNVDLFGRSLPACRPVAPQRWLGRV